jgi:hypothetical protein
MSYRILPTLTAVFLTFGLYADDSKHAEWNADNLVKTKLCMLCHKKEEVGDQVSVWKEGPHAHAFEALKSDKAKEVAAKMGVDDPTTSGKCLKCHSTAYGFTESRVTEDIALEEGVTCQTCHGPGKDYKSKTKHAKDPEKAKAELGLIEPTEANTCSRCHGSKDNPTHDPTRYKLKDGSTADFDFEQAWEKIKHTGPQK